jgi:transcriptional regulator with XRE-family HTH domain
MTTTTWQSTPAGKAFLLRHGRKKKVRITWLARARILSGQSVAQAAKACGLNPRTWAAWEHGGKAPSSRALIPLTARYDCTTYDLVEARFTIVDPATLNVVHAGGAR